MAAQLPGEEDDIIADINVTPLVDIVLVLLIIFMVTATYIIAPSIQVELPKAASGEETPTSTFAVAITKGGQLFLNGTEIAEGVLAERVRAEKAKVSELQVIISADKEVAHGEVVRLIDLVKLNGVTRFAINIDLKPAISGAAGVVLPPGER